MFIFREAGIDDLFEIHAIRINIDRGKIDTQPTYYEYREFLTKGKSWVCLSKNTIVGFVILDVLKGSIWSLCISDDYYHIQNFIQLHDLAISWYFTHYSRSLYVNIVKEDRIGSIYFELGWKKFEDDKTYIKLELPKDRALSRMLVH